MTEKGGSTMKRQAVCSIATAVVVAFSLLLWGETAQAQRKVSFGTTSSESGMYAWHCAHATIVNKSLSTIHMTAVENPGAAGEVIERIRKGQLDMGIGGVDLTSRAIKGIDDYKGKANPKLRIACVFSSTPFTIFAVKKSGVNSLKDLDGKKFGTGFPYAITGQMARRLFDALGIKPNFFEAGFGANVDGVKDGRLVGFVKPGAPDSSILDIASTTEIKIIPITQKEFEIAQKKYPDYFITTDIIPARTYPGQNEDVLAVPVLQAWVTTSDLPQNVGYEIVKVWYKNRASLAAMYAAANREKGELGFPKLTLETAITPLHAGAVQFYRELGLNVPDRLVPPEMKK